MTGARTVGRVFTAPDGRTYRPSMFVTLTLASYGPVTAEGVPVDPARYDYGPSSAPRPRKQASTPTTPTSLP